MVRKRFNILTPLGLRNQPAFVLFLDLLHLLENWFDRKRISANPSPNPIALTLTLILKHNNVFGLTK